MAYFLARLLLSLFLVLSTYNPSGYSFLDWLAAGGSGPLSLKVTVGITLVILYYAVLRIVYGALRRSGVVFGGVAALLFAVELISFSVPKDDGSVRLYLLLAQYVVLVAVALVIAFGVSWSAFVERLTGQLQKRYVQR